MVSRSPQSSRDALKAQFQRFDADADGYIDRSEFAGLLDVLGAGLTEAEAEHAFSDIDANGSGKIDFDEFCGFWRFAP